MHQEHVEFVAAVEGHEKFEEVAVGDDQAGGEHDLGHVLQVAHGDEVFEVVGFAQRNGEGQHHGKAGVDRAGDEIGREDRGVPAGNDGDGEVEAHDGVHGEHQRRRQAREKQIRRLVAMPVPRRAAPAHRQHAVNDLLGLVDGAIAKRGQVRNQADEPEQQRNRAVRGDRENVPDERAAELRPEAHRARIREHVIRHPRPPGVDQREQCRRTRRRKASWLPRSG